jgi:hypothetical protein
VHTFAPEENLSSFESDERNLNLMDEVTRVSKPKFILYTLNERLNRSKSKNNISSSYNSKIFEIDIQDLKDSKIFS